MYLLTVLDGRRDPYRVGRRCHIVRTHAPGAASRGQHRSSQRRCITLFGGPQPAVPLCEYGAQESLARRSHQNRKADSHELVQSRQQRQVVLRILGESQPRIDYQPILVDSCL